MVEALPYTPVTPENVKTLSVSDKVIQENIPQELKAIKRWCVWLPIRAEDDPEKIKKVPSQKDGYPCDWTKPEHLMPFDEAYKTLEDKPEFGGLQFSIYDSDDFVGFDYDHCLNSEGKIKENVLSDIEKLGFPYAEYSPSSQGVRVLLYGSVPKNYHQGDKPEIYCKAKPLTITGRKLEKANKGLITADKVLQDVVNSYYPAEDQKERNTKRTLTAFKDKEILERLKNQKNGAEIIKAYAGEDVCNDRSATDFKVITAIAFYTQNIAQIYRMFENSGLYRKDKCNRHYDVVPGWEEEVEKAEVPKNYLTLTICRAIDRLSNVFGDREKNTETGIYCKVGNYTVNAEGVILSKSVIKMNPATKLNDIIPIEVKLTATVVFISAFGYNERDQKYYAQIKIQNPHNKFITKWVEPEQLTIKRNLLSMANQISMTDSDADGLTDFFKFSIDEAKKNQITEVYSAIGYQKDNTCFVLGDRKVTAKSIEEIVPIDMPLASKLIKKGSVEGYAKAGRELMQFDALRMKTYAMHASVLLPLVYHKNVTVTHTAVSGNLKGQSSYWIMGAYGHPIFNANKPNKHRERYPNTCYDITKPANFY